MDLGVPGRIAAVTEAGLSDRGFETVLDMVEAACRGLIDGLRAAGKA
jgi:hypothetical protein